MRIAEGHDALILGQQEIENRQVEIRVIRPGAHLVRAGPGGREELSDLLLIRRQPGKCPEGEQLRSFLRICHAFPCGFPPIAVGKPDRGAGLERIS